MPGVREKLNQFLDRAAVRPFEWGVSDCMLEIAEWLDTSCGFDLANEWRGRYATEDQAYALVSGDLLAAMRAAAARLGVQETAQPLYGDVALVTRRPEQDWPLGAILMPSGRWRMKTATGIVLTRDVTVICAWSLPCRPKPPERP